LCGSVKKYKKQELSYKQINLITKKLADEGIYSIFYTRGEPFIRDDTIRILKNAIDLGINVTVSTNAQLICDQTAINLSRIGVDEIQVSIHGLEATHDRIVRKRGSFRKALKSIRSLTENEVKVIVASVGMKRNYRELLSLAKFLADHYKISAFRVLRLMPNDKSLIEVVIGLEECKWLTIYCTN